MTHVELQPDLLPLLGRVDNVLDGLAGFVEHYDFSRANSSYEARVQAITKVASICYQSPKALGSISLFDRLQAESGGLPSSSYEFIPVLLERDTVVEILSNSAAHQPSDVAIIKFGSWLSDKLHLLTNLRALIEMVGPEASLNYLNTSDEEIQIIRDNFKVFLFNVDLSTRAQMVRHRVSWQELSRRYVSGTKSPFEFYQSKKLAKLKDFLDDPKTPERDTQMAFEVNEYFEISVDMYNHAIASGVKPEEARRILPQAMMTQIWGAFQPSQLDNWFNLRLHKTAQLEIRCVAQAMQELIHMPDIDEDLIQAQYKAELGQTLSDKLNDCVSFIMLADFAEVPPYIIDKLGDYAHDYDHGLTLEEQQYILEQSLVDGIFSLDLFNSKFPVGPYVEVYPAEYATKAVYKYILTNSLRNNHD